MRTPACFTEVRKYWNTETVLSKGLILTTLLLLVMAYLPTLQFDYVTQDQWRAFRYSTLEQTPYERAKACVETTWKFYVQTGRPLVWMTECVEHTAVAKISDFIYLRPLVLSTVLITAVYLGAVLAPIVGGLAMGILAASAFLMAPGYSFMYLQGMPALMVLISVILAAASFSLLRKWSDKDLTTQDFKITKLWAPFFLFVSSCLMYPAWAFLVVPLAWIAFGFDQNKSWSKKIKSLCLTLLFYFSAAVFYYLFVKITAVILFKLTGYNPDLGPYQVAVQLSPGIIWERILESAKYFYAMPPLNFHTPEGLPVVLLGLFTANTTWCAYKNKNMNLLSAIAFSGLIFIIGCVILLASISPWLFSRMDSLSTRHLIPWYLFFCATFVGLIFLVAKNLFPKISSLAPVFTLIVCMIPIAAIQNKLSFLEVVVSEIEIQNMRSILGEWLEGKGYLGHRYLLVVRPSESRPAFVKELLDNTENIRMNGKINNENAMLSSAGNPVTIPWMINALLREKENHPVGKSVEIVDCSFDQNCANNIVADSAKVALGITNGDVPIKSIENPFIINNSAITSKPINPVIERVVLPDVKASSQMESLGPQGLFFHRQPGWHAERNPKYPQTLLIDFHEPRSFGTIGLLPQDGNVGRAPKAIGVEVSSDGESWTSVAATDNACTSNASQEWRDIKFAKPVKMRYLKILIFSNCGDPEFLTLRGLRVE
ncbi:F5/8 type C domain-containing protein [Methylobacter tundripaludum]|uniref:F5/8 type C domain-containing protein n=1 Tax=Methylobacter tundripaludum TaxID=173365 RepID=A0A2S6H265_9GAMM|nr:discoidin domain-containing protein [Methylobacter tundripaludum]PPK71575.1 F5/8 type C domain-containing protein [Methylobacter tundripaludum]